MSALRLTTVARTATCAMRRVIYLDRPTNVYVFVDLTGNQPHSIVTPEATDLLGDGRVENFDSLPDLATALRDRFELPF